MTFTKEQLVKEAVNTLMEMGDDSFFELANATITVRNLLARFGINENDMVAEVLKRQQEEANGVE